MDSSFANIFAAFEESKESTKIDIPLGEKRKFIQPASLKNPKLEELMMFLIDWINATLKQDHIVVKSLEEDLYDGLVLHHLLVIHNKDLIATLHLLVAIAKHFSPGIHLPENVCVETIILEIDKTGIKTTKDFEYITEKRTDDKEQSQIQEADNINNLFKLEPDKIKVVQQALLHFVNKHVGRLGVTVKDLSSQFSNGVILILLIGQLEGYFIHLSKYYLSPTDDKEKLHNVSFVLELLEDRGLLNYTINPQDIINLDIKATMRILHCLFAKYKDK
ncbi:gamma-parvin isoform X2 [Mobula hypostoma]|uniref:gamma-parvin isoform X2 n=1 Tax=Mobula hypostoma TaxID=723540 RepID=UPI002FC399F3